MKYFYRSLFLTLVLCASANFASAAGHIVTITPQSAFCFNTCNGSATSSVSGGTGPFTYQWMPGNMTTANVSNLCAGTYTLSVTDLSDMSIATRTVNITQPSQITLTTAFVNPATCSMNNGSAQFIVSGGVAPYSYSWVPTGGTTPTISNATAGTYTLMVTDANGCNAWGTVTILNSAGPTVTSLIASPNTICAGGTSQLTANVSGGTGPYTYNWSNPATLTNQWGPTPTASPTTTTVYAFTVTDQNGCVGSQTVQVNVNAAVLANVTSADPTCNQPNGSLTVNVTQAAPPFNIAWSNGPTTAVNNNLTAGIYSVTVTDNSGCSLTLSSGLSNIGGPAVTTSATSTGCTNYQNGSATANVTGIAPFTFNWNTNPVQTTQSATNLGVGNYLVTVTDSAGCISIVPTQVNSLSGNLYLFANSGASANCSAPTGQAHTFVAGGQQPYSYLWSNSQTTPSISGLTAGIYTVTLTDANGCTVSGSATVQSSCASVISGRVYLDLNNDGVYNSGDAPLTGMMMSGNQYSAVATTDSGGVYRMHTMLVDTFDVTYLSNMYLYNCASPVSGHAQAIITMNGDSVNNLDFVFTTSTPFQDLYLSLVSGVPRPGFSQLYSIYTQNRGTTTVSDTIWFHHDPILSLISATPAFDGYTAPDGYWLFNNFAPTDAMQHFVTMQVPTIPNGGYLGRQLISNARIEPTSSDTTSPDNGDDELDVIVGSYDPNLKECWSPTMNSSGDIWPADLTLDYTIHFQNTGTDTAFTVVVVDTLPAELDIATFRMGASSHSCTYAVTAENGINTLTVTFMNILLVDSTRNEPASHGFFQFTIDRFANLPIGTQIMNEGNNYFDFNPAIVTNMNVVTVSDPLNVGGPAYSNVVIYPNPAQDNVNIRLGDEYAGINTLVTLRDITGREICIINSNGSTVLSINTENCASGMYFITIESAVRETVTQQLILSGK